MLPGVEQAIMRVSQLAAPFMKEAKRLNDNLAALVKKMPVPAEDLSLLHMVDPPVHIDPRSLDAVGEPEPLNRLLGTIHINGVPHHCELIEVKVNDQDCQEAVSPAMESSLSAMWEITGVDGHYATMQYNGRDYVLNICPFCR